VICANVIEEAARLVDESQAAGLQLRVLGGVAIALHAPGGLPAPLTRSYGDIDLVTPARGGRAALRFLETMGYESNVRFNAMNGHTRLVLYDRAHGRQADVFVGEFRMCHRIPVADRLALEARTIPLAELLTTKLQIVRLNAKDVRDIYGILVEHDVGEGDEELVNAAWLARLLAADWGLWRTCQRSFEMARAQLADSGLAPGERALIEDRMTRLRERVDREPKSLRWRSRARIGDRVRWYEEPEEIAHAAPVAD
jgi:hypothetical protein